MFFKLVLILFAFTIMMALLWTLVLIGIKTRNNRYYDSGKKAVKKDLYDSNAGLDEQKINNFIYGDCAEEISRQDYNSLLVMSLFDTQEQRIKTCNKSEILKGKLYGSEIK